MSTETRASKDPGIQDQWVELYQLLRRHILLVGLTIIGFVALGLLYYIYAPRSYESTAELLISTKEYGGFRGGDKSEYPTEEKTIETHIELVSSPLIVGAVVEQMKELPDFLKGTDNPVQVLRDCMTVTLKNENSMVLLVKLRCPDPHQSQEILGKLVEQYQEYMGQSAAELGHEIFSLIAKAKDDLAVQIRQTEKRRNEFRATAPLLWEGETPVNIHHERQRELEVQRGSLLTERAKLSAKIVALERAMEKEGASREALYYEAMRELQLNDEDPDLKAMKIAEQEQFAEREAVRQSASLLMAEFVRLKVEQSELLDEFDAGHPKAIDVGARIDEVRNMLIAVLQNRTPIDGLLLTGQDSPAAEKDYVRIYMQMLRDRLAVLEGQIEQLNSDFKEEQAAANTIVKYQHQDQEFTSDLTHLGQLFEPVVARLKEIDLLKSYGGDTMTPIALPRLGEQVAPKLLNTMAIASFLGTIASALLSWLVDTAQKTFHSIGEIRRGLGIPVLGRVPIIQQLRSALLPSLQQIDPILCTVHQERSVVAESFRGLRTRLYFSGSPKHRVVQITSPSPGDGKSTIAANLAVAIARSGKRVLLIDADFRRPALDKLMGLPAGACHGLPNVMAGKATWEEAARPTPIENLYFIPAVERPKNPSELLSTIQFDQVLEELREHFDFVILDTPPLLPVTDPCVVAARVDAVLLVMRIRRGVQVTARRALEVLHGVEANVLGVVVNGVGETWGHGSSKSEYGYGYEYAHEHNLYHADLENHRNGHGKSVTTLKSAPPEPVTAVKH
jgi:capsular exopolysaccharide synthesis family protein